LNETNRKRDKRKFYKYIRNLYNLPDLTTLVCKDKDGNIILKKRTLEGWQKYFKQLLNPETESINSLERHEDPINNSDLEEPTNEELNEIIKNLKPNKAACPDEMLPEFIKNADLTLKQIIYQIIMKMWKKNTLSKVRRNPVSSVKKEDRKQCNTYTGISLLNIIHKIFAILLYN